MSRIVIAEPQQTLADRFLAAASESGIEEVTVVATLEEAIARAEASSADVLLVGPLLAEDRAFEAAVDIAEKVGTATVIVAPTVSTGLLRKGIRAGVADVLSLNDTTGDIAEALSNAVRLAARHRGSVHSTTDDEDAHSTKGKVITVFSTKGGVGKTVLATNIAVVLAQETGKQVALVDLDLEFGDVGIMLGIRPTRTIADVTHAFDRLDAELLNGYLEKHSSGVRVLLAPVRPEDAETIVASRLSSVLQILRESYDFVVVDTSPSFSEQVLAALDKSDLIYVVTMMDVASIKNTRISLQKLHQLGYDGDRLRIVLNRADSKVLLQPGEVEEAIGGRITQHIPSDRIVPRSVNKGVPVVIDMPKSNVARSMMLLARDAAKAAGNSEEADHVA